MSYVLLIGAYERDNFGDILYGNVFEKILQPVTCLWGSLIGRDMRRYGGAVTFSVVDALAFFKNGPPLAVIHCGGQILGVGLTTAMEIDLDPEATSGTPSQELFKIGRLITGKAGPVGYVYSKRNLFGDFEEPPPVTFFSVGGTAANFIPHLKSALADADFVGVRDRQTQKFLTDIGVHAELYPDVVHTIAKHFPVEQLKALSPTGKAYLSRVRPYLVFQASENILSVWDLRLVAEKIARCCQLLHCDLVLQPAGTAPLHDRLATLIRLRQQIARIAPPLRIDIQEDRNVWAQVATIANCLCWAGTSLHGRIVATAYGRPRISFVTQKTQNYVASWETDSLPVDVVLGDLCESVQRACAVPKDRLAAMSAALASKAEEGIRQLLVTLKLDRLGDSTGLCSNFDATSILSCELDRLRSHLVRVNQATDAQ